MNPNEPITLAERAKLEEMLLANLAVPQPNAQPQDEFPLTPGQESLWFLEQFRPELPTYNVPQAFKLSGQLDPSALNKAIQTVVGRHYALRTRLLLKGEKVFQRIHQVPEFDFNTEDLSSLTSTERAPQLAKRLHAEVTRTFDLLHDLPLRVTLFALGPREHVILFVMPHIVCDMTSLHILYSEVATAYKSLVNGVEPALGPLPGQFCDFVKDRSLASTNGTERDAAFWKEHLAHAVPGLHVPVDFPRTPRPSGRGDLAFFQIPAVTVEKIRALSQQHGASLYMTFLAAWQTLLYRYSHEEDFLIGVPFSQRDFPGAENMIGYLINLLVFRSRPVPSMTFEQLLQETREQALQLYDHPNVPFNELVRQLNLPREGGNSICPVVFQYLPGGFAQFQLEGFETEVVPVNTETAKFDLTLTLAENDLGVLGEIEYRTDLFQRSTIDRIGTQFLQLLESILANPHSRIATLNILEEGERELLLGQWAGRTSEYPRQSTVPELFEQQAAATPDLVAVRSEDQQLTYAGLNARANKLARFLSRNGVKPGASVGVCLDRSVELIATLLAILKAGAAYVPLDPKYPADRLETMMQDAGVQHVITSRRHSPAIACKQKIVLEDRLLELGRESSNNPLIKVSSTDRCYIMYTSGSTGTPKGVAVPHRAVVRLVRNTNFCSFTGAVFLHFAPLSFDASTLEIWGPLLNGSELVVYPASFDSLEQFEQVLEKNKVSTLWLTAGLFNSMVDQKVTALRSVKQLLVGGDVLSVPHIRKAQAALPDTTLINGYGPTENTTFTCCYRIPPGWPADRSIPIGSPITNTTVYILDKEMQPVPIGIIGEIYTGGDGLALHYINDQRLTAEKFIPHPFVPGERLYRTGDFGRFLQDGTIEFMGRADNQVKIRGFRIELGEIELTLNQLPRVKECAVVAIPEPTGTRAIVAYIVLEKGKPVLAAELREQLSQKLPEHMVPSHFLFMDQLPLNPNGKVHRSALPAPDFKTHPREQVAPSTEAEKRLVEIWKEVLNLPQLGVTDNFFDLGGHSLLATRIISRTNQAFNIRLSLSSLFESPTVSALARKVDASTPQQSRPESRRLEEDPAKLLSRLNDLNDAEVDALLTQLLPK